MRLRGSFFITLFAIFYTACKTAFYLNEANGALKRAGVSDHRFDQGEQWWEQLIFGAIIIFSFAFALSNQITISKEMKRIMSPKTKETEEHEAEQTEETHKTNIMKVVNVTGRILSIPTTLWKTTVTTQSTFRFVYGLFKNATKSEGISLGMSSAVSSIALVALLACNYVFFNDNKPSKNNIDVSNELTPLLESKPFKQPIRYTITAHGLSLIVAFTNCALYFNSAINFLPHLSDAYKPLTALDNTGSDIGFAFVVLGIAAIGASTQSSYSRRLMEYLTGQYHHQPNRSKCRDIIDASGTLPKACTSSMSLIALAYRPLGLWAASSLALLAFPGNLLGEAATFLPSGYLSNLGHHFGIHAKKQNIANSNSSKITELDSDSAIESDYEQEMSVSLA